MSQSTELALEDVAALVRDTAKLYVGTPEKVVVKFTATEGGMILFRLRGDQKDDGRLIGRDGSHAAAMGRVLRHVGAAADRRFAFKILTDARREHHGPAVRSAGYDPEPAKAVLARWLAAFAIERPSISVEDRSSAQGIAYDFDITVEDRTQAAALFNADDDQGGVTPIGALGTLFRAVGKQAGGVRLQVNLV